VRQFFGGRCVSRPRAGAFIAGLGGLAAGTAALPLRAVRGCDPEPAGDQLLRPIVAAERFDAVSSSESASVFARRVVDGPYSESLTGSHCETNSVEPDAFGVPVTVTVRASSRWGINRTGAATEPRCAAAQSHPCRKRGTVRRAHTSTRRRRVGERCGRPTGLADFPKQSGRAASGGHRPWFATGVRSGSVSRCCSANGAGDWCDVLPPDARKGPL